MDSVLKGETFWSRPIKVKDTDLIHSFGLKVKPPTHPNEVPTKEDVEKLHAGANLLLAAVIVPFGAVLHSFYQIWQ